MSVVFLFLYIFLHSYLHINENGHYSYCGSSPENWVWPDVTLLCSSLITFAKFNYYKEFLQPHNIWLVLILEVAAAVVVMIIVEVVAVPVVEVVAVPVVEVVAVPVVEVVAVPVVIVMVAVPVVIVMVAVPVVIVMVAVIQLFKSHFFMAGFFLLLQFQ